MTNSREKIYPLDIVYVKVSVDRKLLDSVRKVPFKTSNNFPTITLQRNKMENNKIKIKITYKNENEPQHIYCLFSIFSFCTFFFFCFLYSLLFLFFCFFPFFSYAFYILFLFLLFFFGFLFSTS